VFGYIGDQYGRRSALFMSLSGLGIVSLLLAFAPTYEQVGMIAPLFLMIGRMLQNFFGIGENLGGGIYLLENTEEKHQDLISSLYSSSTVAGFLLASVGVSVLCYYQVLDDYWRILYLIGGITSLFGCILRRSLPLASYPNTGKMHFSIRKIFASLWGNRQTILLIALIAGFSYANASISLVFLNGFIPLVSKVSKEQMIHLNTFLLLFDLIALPLFGLLANRFSRQKMMVASGLAIVIFAIPLFSLLEMASLPTIILVRILIVSLGVWFTATFHSWAQKIVPSANRYTFISFGYAIGSQLLGGPIAPFSLWLYKQTGIVWIAACYWVILAAAVGICLICIKQKKSCADV